MTAFGCNKFNIAKDILLCPAFTNVAGKWNEITCLDMLFLCVTLDQSVKRTEMLKPIVEDIVRLILGLYLFFQYPLVFCSKHEGIWLKISQRDLAKSRWYLR